MMRNLLLGILIGALSAGLVAACSNANGQTQNNDNADGGTCQCQGLTKQVEEVQKQALVFKEMKMACSNPIRLTPTGREEYQEIDIPSDRVYSISIVVIGTDGSVGVSASSIKAKDGKTYITCTKGQTYTFRLVLKAQ